MEMKDVLSDDISNMDVLRHFEEEILNNPMVTIDSYKMLMLFSIARSLASIADKMNETK